MDVNAQPVGKTVKKMSLLSGGEKSMTAMALLLSLIHIFVDFVREQKAHIVVKGLRAITDFEYEFQLTALNYELSKDLETFFIMSPPKYMYLSSSIVREMASMGGDVKQFVPECVERALIEYFNEAY